MQRISHRLPSLLIAAALATASLAAPATAQDATEAPDPGSCVVLTADEVSAAFGETLTLIAGDGAACQFDADYEASRFLSLFTSIQTDTELALILGFLCDPAATTPPGETPSPCSVDLTVGGNPAAYLPDSFGTMLYTQVGSDLFAVQLVGAPAEGVDMLATLTGLSELAVGRLGSVPGPVETVGPAETLAPRTGVGLLFPDEVGGQTLEVDSRSGAAAFADVEVPQALLDALDAQGRTLDDVSVGVGFVIDPTSFAITSIIALQVQGADMSAMADTVTALLTQVAAPVERTPMEIAGKQVTALRATAETPDEDLQYLYVGGDVMWLVAAVEPTLSEVFGKLP